MLTTDTKRQWFQIKHEKRSIVHFSKQTFSYAKQVTHPSNQDTVVKDRHSLIIPHCRTRSPQ